MRFPRSRAARAALGGAVAVAGYAAFEWCFARMEIDQGELAVLIAKTGREPPPGAIIAARGEKGVLLETLPPGRHFRNPFTWDWRIARSIDVAPNQVGVVVRLFGREGSEVLVGGPLEPADPGSVEKGILAEVLRPGTHRLNPYAYAVELHPAIEIPPGHVGVVTNLVGKTPAVRNRYLVEPGERGVQKATLGPGVHYLNPYAFRVDPIDVRQKRLEFSAAGPGARSDHESSEDAAITFPSSDGFTILVRLAVVWQIDPRHAPEVLVRIATVSEGNRSRTRAGNNFEDEVFAKVIVPAVRGYARIEGSKFEATQYISGTSRSTFQHALLEKVRAACAPNGIMIHEVLVSDIAPPVEIADPIRQREIAKEELARNKNEVKEARSEQELARETERIRQERASIEGESRRAQRVIAARKEHDVALIDQERLLEVARTDLLAATLEAEAIAARGSAECDVIRARNAARAEPLRRTIETFPSPEAYVAWTLARRLGPGVRNIFADPSSPAGKIVTDLLGSPPTQGVRGAEPLAGAGDRPRQKGE
jgi:regulator of protease activity HflC (stomatin/prohibitin superfamily)